MPKHLKRPVPVKPDKAQIFRDDGKIDMDAMNEAAWQASKQQLVECTNCGRRFQADRLEVHQRSCRPGNAAKKIGAASNTDSHVSNNNPPTASGGKSVGNPGKKGVVAPSNSSVSSLDTIRLGTARSDKTMVLESGSNFDGKIFICSV